MLFHGWLLWERMSAGELLSPSVALRWAAALGVAMAWISHRRSGRSGFGGRRALVLGLLAALIHWQGGPAPDAPLQPAWLLAAPAIGALGVGIIAIHSRPRVRRSPLGSSGLLAPSLEPPRSFRWIVPHLLPRPPPA